MRKSKGKVRKGGLKGKTENPVAVPVQVILPDDHMEAVVGGLRSFIVNT